MPPRKLRSASVRAGRGARLTSRGGRGRGGRGRGRSSARGAGEESPSVRRGRRRGAANMVTQEHCPEPSLPESTAPADLDQHPAPDPDPTAVGSPPKANGSRRNRSAP